MDRIYIEIIPEHYEGDYPALTIRIKDSQRHFGEEELKDVLGEALEKWMRERVVSDET